MKVKLYTKDGGFVHEQEIPPFTDQPTLIIWGQRFFVCPDLDGPVGRHVDEEGDDECSYEEAFTYALILVGSS